MKKTTLEKLKEGSKEYLTPNGYEEGMHIDPSKYWLEYKGESINFAALLDFLLFE